VAADHRIGFVREAFAFRNALAQVALILFEVARLAVPPVAAVWLVGDKKLLCAPTTINGRY